MCDINILNLPEEIFSGNNSIAVVGVGYVGLPLAIAFSKKCKVIAFDANSEKINCYKNGNDVTGEVLEEDLRNPNLYFTNDPTDLKNAIFYIVAVPTPINKDKTPDLNPVIDASRKVGRYMPRGSVVVYESTVYPGVTEDICVDVLEKESGYKCGIDFKVGYSPERINPGDKVHTLETIVKIVSGMDGPTLEVVNKIYSLVCKGGVYNASSIKVAEAAKVIENSQRDINIAFMNELSQVLHRMDIDTGDVMAAMKTKWNSLSFTPGLVGGHCIGVDPYYFVYQAEALGYHSQLITAGRKINDSMGEFVADAAVKELVLSGKVVKNAKVAVLGVTFKEDCKDTRNSKVFDIIKRLNEFGIEPVVHDPIADKTDVLNEYGVVLSRYEDLNDVDCLIIAVAHSQYKNLSFEALSLMFKLNIPDTEKILIDVKGICHKSKFKENGYRYWRL